MKIMIIRPQKDSAMKRGPVSTPIPFAQSLRYKVLFKKFKNRFTAYLGTEV
jgi:hypothetical protein